MKRNPLKALLRVRGVRERSERGKMGGKAAAERAALEKLEQLKTQHAQQPAFSDLMRPAQLRALQLRGMRSLELLNEAGAEYEAARNRTERQRATWRKASADLDAAEELDARRREQAAHKAQLAAEKALDALMTTRKRRRR